MKLNRRNFIRGSAIAAGGLLIPSAMGTPGLRNIHPSEPLPPNPCIVRAE